MKNAGLLTLVAAAALSIGCESPFNKKDDSKQMTEVSILALAAIAASTPPGIVTGRCQTVVGKCGEYYDWSSSANAQANCTVAASTTYTAGVVCTSASRVASCVYPAGFSPVTGNSGHGSGHMIVRYYSSHFTLATAQTDCNTTGGASFAAN